MIAYPSLSFANFSFEKFFKRAEGSQPPLLINTLLLYPALFSDFSQYPASLFFPVCFPEESSVSHFLSLKKKSLLFNVLKLGRSISMTILLLLIQKQDSNPFIAYILFWQPHYSAWLIPFNCWFLCTMQLHYYCNQVPCL